MVGFSLGEGKVVLKYRLSGAGYLQKVRLAIFSRHSQYRAQHVYCKLTSATSPRALLKQDLKSSEYASVSGCLLSSSASAVAMKCWSWDRGTRSSILYTFSLQFALA